MRTWTATTTTAARPESVLDVLCDPEAAGCGPTHPPLPFDGEELDGRRLATGSRARVSGKLAGRRVGFEADYRLAPVEGGSEVQASVSVRPSGGIVGRLLAP